MAELIKMYQQSIPATKFVGKCYGDADRHNGTFSHKWAEWFSNNLFAPLNVHCGDTPIFEDGNAYYGACCCKKDGSFQYWIGALLPVDATVPEGYLSADFEPSNIVTCWVKGKEPDIYFFDSLAEIKKAGYKWVADKNGDKWAFERYAEPRFTHPDSNGEVILDMCYFI